MFSIYMSFEVVYSITFKGTLLTTKGCILMLTFDMSCKILLLLKPVQTPHTTPGHVECLYNTDKFQKCTPIYNLNRPTSFTPPQLLLLNCSSSIAPPQLLYTALPTNLNHQYSRMFETNGGPWPEM